MVSQTCTLDCAPCTVDSAPGASTEHATAALPAPGRVERERGLRRPGRQGPDGGPCAAAIGGRRRWRAALPSGLDEPRLSTEDADQARGQRLNQLLAASFIAADAAHDLDL
jgi:hypothetical protein